MIFRPELARLVVRGKKTQTRRPMKPYVEPESPYRTVKGRRVRRAVPKTIEVDGTRFVYRYEPGGCYAVQPGRGKAAVCRVLVDTVEPVLLTGLDLRDALAEGFRTRAEFADYWMRLYQPAWARERGDVALGDDQELVLDRFETGYEGVRVWAIRFAVDQREQPRFLRARMGSVSDYTENQVLAAEGEPETVPPAYQRALTEQAHERDERLQKDAVVVARREIDAQLARLEEVLHPNEHTTRRLEVLRRELRLLDRDLKGPAYPEFGRKKLGEDDQAAA